MKPVTVSITKRKGLGKDRDNTDDVLQLPDRIEFQDHYQYQHAMHHMAIFFVSFRSSFRHGRIYCKQILLSCQES